MSLPPPAKQPPHGTGLLIVIDGIDGAGKSTQVATVAAALRAADEPVITSREPTDGPWGKQLRASATHGRLPPEKELEAFVQDRRQHLRELIEPALAQGRNVILDRYFYSTIAYQGDRSATVEALHAQLRAAARVPDVAFLLDLEPELALQRIQRRGQGLSTFEREQGLRRTRAIYRWLARMDAEAEQLTADGPPASVRAAILRRLLDGVLRQRYCVRPGPCPEQAPCELQDAGGCRWHQIRDRLVPYLRERWP